MPSDCEPTLAAFTGAIEQHVRDSIAPLPPRSKAGQRRIPNGLAGSERPHLPQSNSAPHYQR